MKRTYWFATWWMIVGFLFAVCFALFLYGASKYKRGRWVTLAKNNATSGGYCFVRQMGDPFPFCEVGFGFVTPTGTQFSFFLDHEGFPWSGVDLVEKNGTIHVQKSGKDVALFDVSSGCFTNLIFRRAFDQQNGLSGGYGSSFFALEP